jgi:CRISPR system Cascade subunit CasD
VTYRWLVLHLDAPLIAFGGVAIDQVGPVRDFPAASMLTGLIANALGWHWSERTAHQALQDRLIFAARREQEGALLTDTQNAQLYATDTGWTTHGTPERRGGASYGAPHRRQRDYHADLSARVVLRLAPEEGAPTLDDLAEAFDRPARPLFLGRKPCLPTAPLLPPGAARWAEGESAHAALASVPAAAKPEEPLRALWPAGEGPESGEMVDRVLDLADLRNWLSGLHGGARRVVEGRMMPEQPR